jgi:hypothetical protein
MRVAGFSRAMRAARQRDAQYEWRAFLRLFNFV